MTLQKHTFPTIYNTVNIAHLKVLDVRINQVALVGNDDWSAGGVQVGIMQLVWAALNIKGCHQLLYTEERI